MKFYKNICFTWIRHTFAKLFPQKLMPYALYKYNRNIFNLLKSTSMDFCSWALLLYLETEAQNTALEIPEDEIPEESGVDSILHSSHRLLKKDSTITKCQALEAFELFKKMAKNLIFKS